MKLRLTLKAESDLEGIATYLFSHNPAAARRVEAELQAAFALIQAYPHVGSAWRRGARRFALPRFPYLIFYRVDEQAREIAVLTVRHTARRPLTAAR